MNKELIHEQRQDKLQDICDKLQNLILPTQTIELISQLQEEYEQLLDSNKNYENERKDGPIRTTLL